ncbi:hypothetical protein [Caulobacter sp. X]|uniref:hypothetical protein n=1 Tax=Caulobacter sp. X TaxID=2048901 RepID=UPI000C160E2B|nr:hypothetical protein [Caulobacter sp. X]PIC00873.1 hypothetical protein CSW60_04785 [Caulobacter sp. X]
MIRTALTAATALLFVTPAFAEAWPSQDWSVMKVVALSSAASASARPDGGANPPMDWMTSANGVLGGPSPNAAKTVAFDTSAVSRNGRTIDLTYYVWAQDKMGLTEVTSRIDCRKTGETVLGMRKFGADLRPVASTKQSFRKVDAMSRAVAQRVCAAPKDQVVSGKSLPELFKAS